MEKITEYDMLTRSELVQLIVKMRAENTKLHSAIARCGRCTFRMRMPAIA